MYVDPKVKPKFDTLPQELKDEINARNVTINNINDLMKVLEDISKLPG